ncbi:fimbria/pilus outer membrane usher protein [Acidovorax sp. SUPP2522]|uniref:fimbria/pilus outer membrane usher protein n=1 Tax=unclassified Acidovorax TaxID=2684926 RepID=UPI00234A5DC4|nr:MULTISPECIES: fimbria/pilus outer membrane usher protein [unclassified Acidovorax]WCM98142.1 fimbria/pilus outer membrane usher protein [Acidovorax sp. GBBC 1281]GKT18139.1 fimbria/pilus outer membrane usher protein [Acidovorax sp. SUPP2522]
MHRNEPRPSPLRTRIARWGVLAACLPRLLSASDYPVPDAHAGAPVTLFLEIVVNGRTTGEVVKVQHSGPHYEIDAETLRELSLQTPEPDGAPVAVDTLPGVSAQYDSLGQRLLLQVPPEWLPMQDLADHSRTQLPLGGGSGLLFNYDAYTMTTQGRTTSSVWSEARYFGEPGVVSSTGILRRGATGMSTGFVRYDTQWTRPETQEATQTVYGDVITGSLQWSTPVRMGGVQWSRNFSIRPDLVTYPLPAFSGQAAVPSAVDVFINGFRAANRAVAPGPFTLGELPTVNGSGTASVVTTDAQGRQVLTSVPFYVNTQLLRPGWTDYSLSLGALRRAYGFRSLSYGRPLASGVYRQGITEAFTLETQAQAGRGLGVAGAGGLLRLGLLGVANASVTRGQAQRDRGGWQVGLGYQFQSTGGGISMQQLQRTPGYGDASTYADDGFQLPRRTRQLDASLNVARGSFSVGWVDLQSREGQRSRLAYAGYSTPLGDRSYLSFTAGRTLETGQTQMRLQLTYVLGPQSSAQTAVARYGDGTTQAQASVQRTVPSDGGFGWNLGHTVGGQANRYSQASALYRGDSMTVQGGAYGMAGHGTRFAGAAGSIGLMDGYAFASNRISDGFALVSTDGMADVPVLFNHQRVGRTNARGYLLVPEVPAYYEGRYEIDPLALPADVHTPSLEKRVAVARGTGTLVRLPVMRVRTATITLVDGRGAPLPAGTAVVHEQGNVPTVVGWDGVVYLTALQARNTLVARLPDGEVCRGAFSEQAYAGTRDLRVVCRTGDAPADAGPEMQS